MSYGYTYSRRLPQPLVTDKIADVFSPFAERRECWMFVAPHDDDVLLGAGLTVMAALAEEIPVHVVITTDGRMGYCTMQQRRAIAQIRAVESCKAYGSLGIPVENIHFLHFPDCNLNPYRGRHFATIGDPTELENASGLQNAYSYMLRKVRPTRVFLPTSSDLHPDHQIVNKEMLISLFHAQGNIWPELGEPIGEVPAVYEYAVYCDFPSPPQIRLQGPAAALETKLDGIRAFASQQQIEKVVAIQRDVGPVEYLREIEFQFYAPKKYAELFPS